MLTWDILCGVNNEVNLTAEGVEGNSRLQIIRGLGSFQPKQPATNNYGMVNSFLRRVGDDAVEVGDVAVHKDSSGSIDFVLGYVWRKTSSGTGG